MLYGRRRAIEGIFELVAWHGALMCNLWRTGNDYVTPDMLLGRSRRVDLLRDPGALSRLAEDSEDDDNGG